MARGRSHEDPSGPALEGPPPYDARNDAHARHDACCQPSKPAQEAFGAIKEIIGTLEADPNTDWSKVDIGALREHLIDMNEVTLNSRHQDTLLRQPVTIELALKALTSLEERDHAIGAQWRRRIERARYDADLAERRYNRLIASTLEQHWNDAVSLSKQLEVEVRAF